MGFTARRSQSGGLSSILYPWIVFKKYSAREAVGVYCMADINTQFLEKHRRPKAL